MIANWLIAVLFPLTPWQALTRRITSAFNSSSHLFSSTFTSAGGVTGANSGPPSLPPFAPIAPRTASTKVAIKKLESKNRVKTFKAQLRNSKTTCFLLEPAIYSLFQFFYMLGKTEEQEIL